MAKFCEECGKKIHWLNDSGNKSVKRCFDCNHTIVLEANRRKKQGLPADDRDEKAVALANKRMAEIDSIILTTETAPSLNITKRIEVITAECAFGMNIFKDLFAAVRDVVGGRSEAVQKTLRDSRETVLYELKKEAHRVGANAVVGIDLDYMELSTGGSMILMVASGTAVIVEDL